MSYPLIIKDNFFSDPDAIVNIINHVDYSLSSNNYPGVRTKSLDEINPKLYEHIFQKIFLLLHDQLPLRFESNLKVGFHKIKPFVEGDKWDKKNRGWVHKDGCLFGGVIYLDKNPDKDAGTSIYKSKDGFDVQTQENIDAKELFYSGQLIDDGHYYNAYDRVRNQYEETLKIPNVYNRLVLIPNDQPHAMTTIGDKERNTLVFFCFGGLAP
tara:strand:- start:67 stop:699 length:633 start_codon:yes stop_codon:yes gene_type:complete